MTDEATALCALFARIQRAPSEFYRERVAAAGTEELARLPLTTRAELVRDQLAHRPHGSRRFADAGHPVRAGSTGSGDDLLVLTWSAADLARERQAGARMLGRLGATAGMRIANTLPGALVTPGSLLLGDVVEDLSGLDVPLGAIESDAAAKQAWELVDRVQPDVLVLDPVAAPRLFGATPPASRPWWRGIVWLRRGATPMALPPVSDATGFTGWQRTWLAVPEASSFVAHSCRDGGFHVDDAIVAEIIDGHLALTPLGGDTPLLRYASGVRAQLCPSPCTCGEPGTVLALD
ncbi:MAG: hypothetical protein HYR72_12285 [Deltaproteobacteria bacterium]|nr:hypothetical protein [Deltaproteobacteria bacterium]MBI3387803.1 hypothetical protein [Deltaproteobacteria bacterium]